MEKAYTKRVVAIDIFYAQLLMARCVDGRAIG